MAEIKNKITSNVDNIYSYQYAGQAPVPVENPSFVKEPVFTVDGYGESQYDNLEFNQRAFLRKSDLNIDQQIEISRALEQGTLSAGLRSAGQLLADIGGNVVGGGIGLLDIGLKVGGYSMANTVGIFNNDAGKATKDLTNWLSGVTEGAVEGIHDGLSYLRENTFKIYKTEDYYNGDISERFLSRYGILNDAENGIGFIVAAIVGRRLAGGKISSFIEGAASNSAIGNSISATKLSKYANVAEDIVFSLGSASYEAQIEGNEVRDNITDRLKSERIDALMRGESPKYSYEQIEEKAMSAKAETVTANMALLTLSNFIDFKMLRGSYFDDIQKMAYRQMRNGGKELAEGQLKNTLSGFLNVGKGIAKEGTEENAQTAIQKYEEAHASNETKESFGTGVLNNILKGYRGVAKSVVGANLDDDEFEQTYSFVLGAALGGPFSVYGSHQEAKQEKQKAIDATKFSQFVKDKLMIIDDVLAEEKDFAGQSINGIDKEKFLSYISVLENKMTDLALKDWATLDNNPLLHSLVPQMALLKQAYRIHNNELIPELRDEALANSSYYNEELTDDEKSLGRTKTNKQIIDETLRIFESVNKRFTNSDTNGKNSGVYKSYVKQLAYLEAVKNILNGLNVQNLTTNTTLNYDEQNNNLNSLISEYDAAIKELSSKDSYEEFKRAYSNLNSKQTEAIQSGLELASLEDQLAKTKDDTLKAEIQAKIDELKPIHAHKELKAIEKQAILGVDIQELTSELKFGLKATKKGSEVAATSAAMFNSLNNLGRGNKKVYSIQENLSKLAGEEIKFISESQFIHAPILAAYLVQDLDNINNLESYKTKSALTLWKKLISISLYKLSTAPNFNAKVALIDTLTAYKTGTNDVDEELTKARMSKFLTIDSSEEVNYQNYLSKLQSNPSSAESLVLRAIDELIDNAIDDTENTYGDLSKHFIEGYVRTEESLLSIASEEEATEKIKIYTHIEEKYRNEEDKRFSDKNKLDISNLFKRLLEAAELAKKRSGQESQTRQAAQVLAQSSFKNAVLNVLRKKKNSTGIVSAVEELESIREILAYLVEKEVKLTKEDIKASLGGTYNETAFDGIITDPSNTVTTRAPMFSELFIKLTGFVEEPDTFKGEEREALKNLPPALLATFYPGDKSLQNEIKDPLYSLAAIISNDDVLKYMYEYVRVDNNRLGKSLEEAKVNIKAEAERMAGVLISAYLPILTTIEKSDLVTYLTNVNHAYSLSSQQQLLELLVLSRMSKDSSAIPKLPNILIQGIAGAGKTRTLTSLIAGLKDKRIFYYTGNPKADITIREVTDKIKASDFKSFDTVSNLLATASSESPQVIIIDEAYLLTKSEIQALESSKHVIVYAGDVSQNRNDDSELSEISTLHTNALTASYRTSHPGIEMMYRPFYLSKEYTELNLVGLSTVAIDNTTEITKEVKGSYAITDKTEAERQKELVRLFNSKSGRSKVIVIFDPALKAKYVALGVDPNNILLSSEVQGREFDEVYVDPTRDRTSSDPTADNRELYTVFSRAKEFLAVVSEDGKNLTAREVFQEVYDEEYKFLHESYVNANNGALKILGSTPLAQPINISNNPPNPPNSGNAGNNGNNATNTGNPPNAPANNTANNTSNNPVPPLNVEPTAPVSTPSAGNNVTAVTPENTPAENSSSGGAQQTVENSPADMTPGRLKPEKKEANFNKTEDILGDKEREAENLYQDAEYQNIENPEKETKSKISANEHPESINGNLGHKVPFPTNQARIRNTMGDKINLPISAYILKDSDNEYRIYTDTLDYLGSTIRVQLGMYTRDTLPQQVAEHFNASNDPFPVTAHYNQFQMEIDTKRQVDTTDNKSSVAVTIDEFIQSYNDSNPKQPITLEDVYSRTIIFRNQDIEDIRNGNFEIVVDEATKETVKIKYSKVKPGFTYVLIGFKRDGKFSNPLVVPLGIRQYKEMSPANTEDVNSIFSMFEGLSSSELSSLKTVIIGLLNSQSAEQYVTASNGRLSWKLETLFTEAEAQKLGPILNRLISATEVNVTTSPERFDAIINTFIPTPLTQNYIYSEVEYAVKGSQLPWDSKKTISENIEIIRKIPGYSDFNVIRDDTGKIVIKLDSNSVTDTYLTKTVVRKSEEFKKIESKYRLLALGNIYIDGISTRLDNEASSTIQTRPLLRKPTLKSLLYHLKTNSAIGDILLLTKFNSDKGAGLANNRAYQESDKNGNIQDRYGNLFEAFKVRFKYYRKIIHAAALKGQLINDSVTIESFMNFDDYYIIDGFSKEGRIRDTYTSAMEKFGNFINFTKADGIIIKNNKAIFVNSKVNTEVISDSTYIPFIYNGKTTAINEMSTFIKQYEEQINSLSEILNKFKSGKLDDVSVDWDVLPNLANRDVVSELYNRVAIGQDSDTEELTSAELLSGVSQHPEYEDDVTINTELTSQASLEKTKPIVSKFVHTKLTIYANNVQMTREKLFSTLLSNGVAINDIFENSTINC